MLSEARVEAEAEVDVVLLDPVPNCVQGLLERGFLVWWQSYCLERGCRVVIGKSEGFASLCWLACGLDFCFCVCQHF